MNKYPAILFIVIEERRVERERKRELQRERKKESEWELEKVSVCPSLGCLVTDNKNLRKIIIIPD